MIVGPKSVHLRDTMVELMCLVIIAMSVYRRQLRAVGNAEMSLLQALLQDRVVDGTNLLHRHVLPERCLSLRQVHEHQSTKFGILTMAG
jgi:hypothetical protein